MKIGVLAVGYKGRAFLQQLKFRPAFVVSYPDRNTDDFEFNCIRRYCEDLGILFEHSLAAIDAQLVDSVDFIFVVGWQFLLKEHLAKTAVFHDSYLPELRGWCPTPTALIAGMDHVGASAFQPTDEVDWGRLYDRRKCAITYPIKLSAALDIVVDMYCDMANEIAAGQLVLGDYPTGKSSYSIWRDDRDMFVEWDDAARVCRQVDALSYPLSGALTAYDGYKIALTKVSQGPEIDLVERFPGKIWSCVNNEPIVICQTGTVRIHDAHYVDAPGDVEFKRLRVRMGS